MDRGSETVRMGRAAARGDAGKITSRFGRTPTHPDREIRRALGVGEIDAFHVGQYRVVSVIAPGGVGIVYRAIDGEGRPCALKLLLAPKAERPLRRLMAEARILMRLDHPNVIKVRDAGVLNGVAFMAMDLVEGTDLERAIKSGSFSPRTRLEIFEKICAAVQYVHDQGVIHRDLKPANVLIARDGTPILADFGLAREVDAKDELADEGVVGTPYYIAPEHLLGGRGDARGDVYGLGVILFELLASRVPFRADSVSAIYRMVLQDAPPPPSSFDSRISPELEQVCLRALAKDPTDRQRTARALAAAVAPHVESFARPLAFA